MSQTPQPLDPDSLATSGHQTPEFFPEVDAVRVRAGELEKQRQEGKISAHVEANFLTQLLKIVQDYLPMIAG